LIASEKNEKKEVNEGGKKKYTSLRKNGRQTPHKAGQKEEEKKNNNQEKKSAEQRKTENGLGKRGKCRRRGENGLEIENRKASISDKKREQGVATSIPRTPIMHRGKVKLKTIKRNEIRHTRMKHCGPRAGWGTQN